MSAGEVLAQELEAVLWTDKLKGKHYRLIEAAAKALRQPGPTTGGDLAEVIRRVATKLHGSVPDHVNRMLSVGADLSAIVALIPEDHFWSIIMDGNGDGFAACCQSGELPILEWHKHETPSRALLAALEGAA